VGENPEPGAKSQNFTADIEKSLKAGAKKSTPQQGMPEKGKNAKQWEIRTKK